MKASHENDAVKDGLESELREYALNPFVKVEIQVECDSKDPLTGGNYYGHSSGNADMDAGLVSN